MTFHLFEPNQTGYSPDNNQTASARIYMGPPALKRREPLSHLHLTWQDPPQGDDVRPSTLLGWNSRLSSFSGRQKEMEELEKWALTPGFISTAWVTGKAGMGKSRLAAEFSVYMKEVHQWAAGFVSLFEPNTFDLDKEDMLVVIDHPEDNKERVTAFLRGLAKTNRTMLEEREMKIRILFLSRQNFSDWQPVVFEAGIESLTHPFPVELTDFSFEAANDIYFSTLSKTLELLGEPDNSTNGDSREAWFQNSEKNRKPDYAIAAGVFKALFPAENLRKQDPKRLIEQLAHYELEKTRDKAASLGLSDPTLGAILQVASNIGGGLECEQAGRIIQALDLVKAIPEGKDLEGFFPEERMAAIEPDALAAAYTAEVLWQTPETAPALIWLSLEKDFAVSLPRFSRLCQNAERELDFARNQLGHWLAHSISESPGKAAAVEPFLTNDLYGLSWPGIEACKVCLENAEDDIGKMRLYAKLSLFYQSSGDRTEALKQRISAVDICEILASHQPEVFEIQLVGQYFELWKVLFNMGERSKAYRVIEKTAELFEKLAPGQPRRFKLDMASCLENLGNAYTEGGEYEKSLAVTKKAVTVYEELVVDQPLVFGPALANGFNNLGNLFGQLGETENALTATRKAINIYEQLTTARREAFEANLAESLKNLGSRYVDTGETEEALKTIQQALDIYEKLAEAKPEDYSGDLAGCLSIQGNIYAFLEEDEKALEITLRVVEIYSNLSNENAVYDSLLASSLNNLSSRYAKAGEDEKALVATETAVKIYDALVESYPLLFDPHLATALNTLAVRQAAIGQVRKALSSAERAIEIYSRLVSAQPEVFEPDLAGCLNNQGNLFAKIGEPEKALVVTELAVDIKEKLAALNPQKFGASLLKSLKNLEQRYYDIGEEEKALIIKRRAEEFEEKNVELLTGEESTPV